MAQKDLADTLGVTDQAVSKWERGLNFPDIAVIAQQEKRAIVKELITRGWLTIILGVILCIAMIYTSKILADNNIFGIAQSLTVGLSGFYGLLIANGIYSIWKGRKLLQ